MSMYNLLFGKNPNSEKILSVIGLSEGVIERFRDVDVDEEANEIIITTRTGGGNRKDYPNRVLTSNPHYMYDEEDEFDRTYAYYHFKIPKEN